MVFIGKIRSGRPKSLIICGEMVIPESGIGGCYDFDTRIQGVPSCTIVEDHDVACVRIPLRDPVSGMGPEELLVGFGSPVPGSRVSPSVQDVASFSPPAPFLRGGLGGCCWMVYYIDFIELAGSQDDLIQSGVVINGIEVDPICLPAG